MVLNPFRLAGLAVTLVVLLFGGIKVVGSLNNADNAVHEATARGGDRSSLFHADRLDSVLGTLRGKVGADAQLLQLAVYPGYMVAEVSTGSEKSGRAFKISGNGDVHEIPLSLNGPGRLKDNIFPLRRLNGATLQKLTEASARKERQSLDGVTHALAWIDPASGEPTWNVYLEGGRYWRAALDGSGLSNPDQQARAAITKAQSAVAAAAPAAKAATDMASCVQAAGADPTKLAACTK